MFTVWLRRPRSSSRAFGLLLALLFAAGQAALIAHHHPLKSRQDGRVSLSQDIQGADEANCGLCALTVQSRASHAFAAVRSAAIAPSADFAFVAPSSETGRTPSLRPSSRAPPAV